VKKTKQEPKWFIIAMLMLCSIIFLGAIGYLTFKDEFNPDTDICTEWKSTITNTPAMTQEQAYEYNDKQGTRMVNTQDLQNINDKEFFKTLNKEMVYSFFLSGTRIEYKDNLMATITPHKGQSITIKIPELNGEFDENNEEQVNYLKALFGENAVSLVKDLAKGNTIYLWTPSQESRNNYPKRAVRLFFDRDGFDINGDYYFFGINRGYSHSVSIESAKQSKINPKDCLNHRSKTPEELQADHCNSNPNDAENCSCDEYNYLCITSAKIENTTMIIQIESERNSYLSCLVVQDMFVDNATKNTNFTKQCISSHPKIKPIQIDLKNEKCVEHTFDEVESLNKGSYCNDYKNFQKYGEEASQMTNKYCCSKKEKLSECEKGNPKYAYSTGHKLECNIDGICHYSNSLYETICMEKTIQDYSCQDLMTAILKDEFFCKKTNEFGANVYHCLLDKDRIHTSELVNLAREKRCYQ